MRPSFSRSCALAAASLSLVAACSYDFDRFVPLEADRSTTGSGVGGASGSGSGGSGGATAGGSDAGGAAGTSPGGAAGSVGAGGGSAGSAGSGPGDMDATVDSRPMNDGGAGADSDAGTGDAVTNDASVADTANEAAIDAESATPDAGGMCSAECFCETYNGHTYRFCTTARSWDASESQCAQAGMRLARVDDAPENGFIRTTADAHGMGEAWIGIEDPTSTLHWQWPDGTEFWNGSASGGPVGGLYNNWGASKPSGNSNRGCASMLTSAFSGTWSDRSCTSLLPYVCELYP